MSTRLLNKEHLATPPELQFNFPANTKGLIGHKQTIKFFPTSGIGQKFHARDTVMFQMKGHRAIDPRSIRLNYKVKILDTTSTAANTPAGTLAQYQANKYPGMYAGNCSQFGAIANATTTHYLDEQAVNGDLGGTEFSGAVPYHSTFLDMQDLVNRDAKYVTDLIGDSSQSKAVADAVSKVNWMVDHGSGVIRTMTLLHNGTQQIERIDRYNRLRGFLSELTIDSAWKNSWGRHEGYQPRLGDENIRNIIKTNQASETAFPLSWDNANNSDAFSKSRPEIAFLDYADRVSAWKHGLETAQNLWVTSTTAATNANDIPALVDASQADTVVDGRAYAWSANTRQVSVPLDLSGWLSQNKIISLAALGSLDIHLLLDDDVVCVNHIKKVSSGLLGSDRENLTYELEDVYITADVFELSPAYNNAVGQALMTSGLIFDHPTYEVLTPPIRQAQSQLLIRRNIKNLKSIWIFFQDKHLINGAEQSAAAPGNDRINKTTNFPSYGLEDYNILVDGKQALSAVVSTKKGESANAMHELAKSLRIHGDNLMGTRFDPDSYHTDCFGIGLDFEKSSLMDGTSMQTLQIDLNFSNSHEAISDTNTDITAFVVLHYDQRVFVTDGAQVSLVY